MLPRTRELKHALPVSREAVSPSNYWVDCSKTLLLSNDGECSSNLSPFHVGGGGQGVGVKEITKWES